MLSGNMDVTLILAMELLEKENSLTDKELKVEIEKCTTKYGKKINTERGYRTYNHTSATARMFNRMRKYRQEDECCLSQQDYERLLRSGTLFYDCVGRLNGLDDKNCAEMLKSCLNRWPNLDMGKKQLTNYIKAKTKGYRHEHHDSLIEKAAIPFLKERGCQIVSTEVLLSGRRKIDTLGWQLEQDVVCGIDVKTTVRDFREKKATQLKEYLDFCDKLYILTDNMAIVEKVYEWNEQEGVAVGILYYIAGMPKVLVLLEAGWQQNLEYNKKKDAQERVCRKFVSEQTERALAVYRTSGAVECLLRFG